MFALNVLIFLVIGVLFGNTMSFLIGCAILVGILFCGQFIASRNALYDFKKFKECPACLMPNMAMARCHAGINLNQRAISKPFSGLLKEKDWSPNKMGCHFLRFMLQSQRKISISSLAAASFSNLFIYLCKAAISSRSAWILRRISSRGTCPLSYPRFMGHS